MRAGRRGQRVVQDKDGAEDVAAERAQHGALAEETGLQPPTLFALGGEAALGPDPIMPSRRGGASQ